MGYYLGQICGVLVTVGAGVSMQMKKKQHIVLISAVVNILAALNILLLDQFGTGVIINLVATAQVFLSLWHDKRGTEPSKAEGILFLAVYILCGLVSFKGWLDILPIVAVVFYMFAIFQKEPQKLRVLMLGNAVSWMIYHGVLRSTAIFAMFVNIGSTLISLYRYRKKDSNSQKELIQ